jgi:hypothetical protein
MDQATIDSMNLTDDEVKIVAHCINIVNDGIAMPGSNLMRIIKKLNTQVKFLLSQNSTQEPEDLAEARVKIVAREMKQATGNRLQDRYG